MKLAISILVLCMLMMIPIAAGAPTLSFEATPRDQIVKHLRTHNSPTNPWTEYEVCNPTVNKFTPKSLSDWNLSFINSEYLDSYDISIWETEIEIINNPVYTTVLLLPFPNGSMKTEDILIGYDKEERIRKTLESYDPLSDSWSSGECKTIRVSGIWKQNIMSKDIIYADNIISFAGKTFSEYAVWNNSWNSRRNITFIERGYTTRNYEPIRINLTKITMQNVSELRIVNSLNLEIPRQIKANGTMDGGLQWAEVDIIVNFTDSIAGASRLFNYTMYYDNQGVGDPIYDINLYLDVTPAANALLRNLLYELDFVNNKMSWKGVQYSTTDVNRPKIFASNQTDQDGEASTSANLEHLNDTMRAEFNVIMALGAIDYNITITAWEDSPIVKITPGARARDMLGWGFDFRTNSNMSRVIYPGGVNQANGWGYIDGGNLTAANNWTFAGGVINETFVYGIVANAGNISSPAPFGWYMSNDAGEDYLTANKNSNFGTDSYYLVFFDYVDDAATNITLTNYSMQLAHPLSFMYVGIEENTYSNYTFINQSFVTPVSEGTPQPFELTVEVNETTVDSITASLIYNNTVYVFEFYNEAGAYRTFRRTITVPELYPGENTRDYQFYWNYTLTYKAGVGGTESAQTTTSNQTITGFNITKCGTGTSDETVLWVFLTDEEARIAVNGSMEATFSIWKTGTSVKSYSFNYTANQTSYRFCIFPTTDTVYANIDLKYGDGNNSYSTRNHYFRNVTLVNTSIINRTIYLLYANTSGYVEFEVKDTFGLIQEDVVIEVQRYFLGEGKYFLVAMGETGFNGRDTIPLKMSKYYRFVLIDENNNILNENINKTFLTDFSYTLYTEFVETVGFFDYFGRISYTCTYTNATTNIVCTYSDGSGRMDTAYLVAVDVTTTGNTQVCSDTSTSSSGTLICTLTGAYIHDNVIMYRLYMDFDDDIITISQDSLDFGLVAVFGLMGIFVTFMLVLVCATIGIWNPVVGIFLVCIAIIFSYAIGFMVLGFGELIGLLIVAGLIIYKVKA